MKTKILSTLAVIVASAIVAGVTAFIVVKLNAPSQASAPGKINTVVDSNFDNAGNHFTSYTPQDYPDLTFAAENAVKAVVGVIKTEEIPQQNNFSNPFFEFFGYPQPEDEYGDSGETRYRERESGGSGVIVSPEGYIVTNYHVVDNASKLSVKLPDGKTYDARLLGSDADTEIALLKIDATGLPSIPFGSSNDLRLGEWVLAIGNPFDLHSTVTAGIVSAKARSLGAIQVQGSTGIESFIQTDAAVNPGNSGGALVNTKGELVGINTLIVSRTGSYAGYSFAVPETIVRKVVADIREFGIVQRGLMGISYIPIDESFVEQKGEETGITEIGGIYVGDVVEGGAAENAGLKAGDVITEIDGIPATGSSAIAEAIGLKRPGDVINISAKRDGKVKQFEIVLRNRAGKSELLPRDSYDAIESLGGELRDIELSDRNRRELGIEGGIRVESVGYDGVLARARIRRGYIITHINGKAINSVNDLYRITEKITSIEGIYPDTGKSATYSMVE